MALNHKSFKDDLLAKDLKYSDEFLELKSERIVPNDSFAYNSYSALKNVRDFKTNNYSNLFLLNKNRNTQWLQANVKKNDDLMGIVTTISFYNAEAQSEKNPGRFLYFSKNYEFFDINIKYVEYLFTENRPEKNYLNYIFYIDFLDDTRCRICHTFGDMTFYLAVESDKTIQFVKEPKEYITDGSVSVDGYDNTTFLYNVDDQMLMLYKPTILTVYNDEDEIVSCEKKIYLLGFDKENNSFTLSENLESTSDNTTILINNNLLDFDFYVNSSWVGYDRKGYIDSIKNQTSQFNLKSQALLHHQYNADDGINFVPLKTDVTYNGNIIRGDNFSITPDEYPDVNFRNYTNIHSGLNQELGNDNIILSYTFHDQVYQINEGDDFYFTIPTKEETNGLEPLYPYESMNIKDTKFVKNGAFGSDSPAFADKVKKLQDNNQRYSYSANNAQYLCTWLYRADEKSSPIWLDRWYYPDFISKRNAYSKESAYGISYENILDKNYLDLEPGESRDEWTYHQSQEMGSNISQMTYFDKPSDLTIEPGCKYCYSRLSKRMVDEVVSNIEPYKISTLYDQGGKAVDISETITLNAENWRKVPYNALDNTNQVNINFDIYIDTTKRIGPQLLGDDYTHGLNIQNRKNLVPYLYYSTDSIIYMLNNKYEICHQFNLSEKYDDKIIRFVQGDMFNDIVIIGTVSIYILSYDLRLKTRISLLVDENGEDKSIYGLSDLNLKKDGKVVNLINYPYSDRSLVIDDVENSNSISISISDWSTNAGRIIGARNIDITLTNNINDYYVIIPSNIADILATQNSILYNSNLYIPYQQHILKFILCPDSDNDVFYNDEKIVDWREEYPIAARKLSYSEYTINYTRTTDSVKDKDAVATINGTIDVENKIKNIYIDEDGHIYGMNYDQISMSADGDTLYGLYSWDKYVGSGGGWWLFNQSLSKMRAEQESSKYAEFQSGNSIDIVRFNSRGEMALLRNFNNLPDNTDDDNYKRIEIYDIAKHKFIEFNMREYTKVLALDSYNFINSAGEEKCVFAMLGIKGGSVYVLFYDSDERKFSEQYASIPSNCNDKFYETVNSTALLRYGQTNKLYFNLHFPGKYLYPYLGQITWDLEDAQSGWYNINIAVDLDKAMFQVKINDIEYGLISMKSYEWFQPFVNSNGTIFANTYFIGCIGKQYGTTLNEILHNASFDPYVCKNSEIENLSIYKKTLTYGEYQAMRLHNSSINTLFITLPCGIRNNIDEIVRYFKYNMPGSISNHVRINIAGTGLQTSGEFEELRNELMTVINNNRDCIVKVDDIQFIS